MRKMTITLEVPYGQCQAAVDKVDVGLLLRDALGEFVSARTVGGSVDAYVDSRYAHMDERFRANKRREVAKRLAAAGALLISDVTIYVESEGDSK